MMNIKDNLSHIHQQIAYACKQANRDIEQVQLLAVTKTKPCDLIEQAYLAGQRQFGESYVQESIEKIAALAHLSDIEWHFIGPIQSNKTRAIATNFSWVHSVDRVKIASRLNEQRCGQDTSLNICLQVNISDEESKSGVSVDELLTLAQYVSNCENLTLRGLMAIPDKNASKTVFDQMFTLYHDLKTKYPTIDTLSMGMSNDLSLAVQSGSTMVRVGSAIFGQRN
ncbi:YggS family pyridoxal phosphate-dependent enzyme [Thalassotalea atypica]|uniref:YggS family pyridoxal phosphate-dependent enzyme n=1 Tax=Thalassotalea atypica TaxID=2054316 RepID=UPI0025735A8F|nr:YggS family pyridoxal phosphate-dependent enzyme [Thalassotalea atypica]